MEWVRGLPIAEDVRNIQQANPDGSLTFFGAIDEGLVLRVARIGDLMETLEHTFTRLQTDVGAPQIVLGCDCAYRRLATTHQHLEAKIGSFLQRHNAVGFSSYGEEYGGVHHNQTFTGIAIGELATR